MIFLGNQISPQTIVSYIFIYFQKMNNKKQQEIKTVHRFTENARMKFRPQIATKPIHIQPQTSGIYNKVTSILGKLFFNKSQTQTSKGLNKTSIVGKSTKQQSNANNQSISSLKSSRLTSKTNENKSEKHSVKQSSILLHPINDESFGLQNIVYLQKITIDTFLIGNFHQIDCITISGIYDNQIDTDFNWSLALNKNISKLAIQPRKGLMAIQCQRQILVYQIDLKKIKKMPALKVKTKINSSPKFILFLKETLLGVFYSRLGSIYQIEENNMKAVFTKKYNINESLQLYQIPKPFQNTLNIFFIEKLADRDSTILWKLQLQFKNIPANHDYKSIVRIYGIPTANLHKLKIDNHSKSISILNFKHQILAAKDGFIIDTANTNIQKQDQYLIYQGDKLIHISDNKVFIYSFKIKFVSTANRIQIVSLDSIDSKLDPKYTFLDCLEMLNGNYVIFYQIKNQYNKKMKGEIDYTIAVTQKLSIKEKLNEIFDFKNPDELKYMGQTNFALLQEKCDMAFKIGLNRKQVYLQLWNKSNKKEVSDYKFLLDTMNYETIKKQIQKKLRKSSMAFSQVYKLQQGCFQMLREQLFSQDRCTPQTIKNFLISHLLLRKLVFYKNMSLAYNKNMKDMSMKNIDGYEQTSRVISIDIQQYIQICQMDIKAYFIETVLKIMSGQIDQQKNLRIFLRQFKFPLRIIYTELLEQLISHSKSRLVKFLEIIPEILPTQGVQNLQESVRHTEITLKEGIWGGEIKPEQWRDNLHIQQISTISNRDMVEQITKTVWFKRNLYTHHDLIAFSKQKIIEIQKSNESQSTFYFLIQRIFHYEPNTQKLYELITFIQDYYSKLPSHLKGKIFLYKNLYDYFKKEKYVSTNIETFNKFLKLKDHQLFKELFNYQKIKKGCLLKDVKYIYEIAHDGIQLYYQGLLHYFQSDLSQISDLKYILNRLNSEKRQFHIQNEGIYNTLVQALQMKLKLGSENDIPIQQVMIYIQNIPLSKDNALIQDLKMIQMINQQSDRFKKMKINMSLKEIVNNCQDVVTSLVDYQIKEKRILQIVDEQQFTKASYDILAQIQTVKDKIYGGKFKDLAYFLYLSKIMQKQSYIRYGNLLLKDEHLLQYYDVDETIVQNLVFYLYKWKFNRQPTFSKNQSYLQELMTLLSPQSKCRQYIQCQLQLALYLSTSTFQAEYPLVKGTSTISLQEIQEIFKNYTVQDILAVDIAKIYDIVKSMQQLCAGSDEQLQQIIKIQQIYSIIIIRLIQLKDLKGSIPYIKTLINMTSQTTVTNNSQNFSIIFCYIILQIILIEVPDNHRKKMLQIVYHLHDCPQQLIEFISKRINMKLSNMQEEIFIFEQFEKVKFLKIYTKGNMLFDEYIIKKLDEKQEKYSHKFEDLCYHACSHINANRDQFKLNVQYSLYFLALLNNPYTLIKYLLIKKDTINLKLFRSYLSYVFREDIFNGLNILYFGRRCFTIILQHYTNRIPLQTLVAQYKELSYQQDYLQFNQLQMQQLLKSNIFAGKLMKSIDVFNRKIKSLKAIQEINKEKDSQMRQKKTKRIQNLLSSAISIKSHEPEQYPFQDSDDNYQGDQEKSNLSQVKKKKEKKKEFDPRKERQFLMQRQTNDKNIALYLSSTGVNEEFSKTHNKIRQTAKVINPYRSLHMSMKGNKNKEKQANKAYMKHLDRVDSINSIGNIDRVSNSNVKKFTFPEEEEEEELDNEIFYSFQPTPINNIQSDSPIYMKDISKSQSPQIQKEQAPKKHDPPAYLRANSLIKMYGLQDSLQFDNYNNSNGVTNQDNALRVRITQKDDETCLPPHEIIKQILYDYGDNENEPHFNLSIIINEQNKQIQNFTQYLKRIISQAYSYTQKPLLFMLQLIKQIKTHYFTLPMSDQFLQYYIALQTSNIKIKAEFKIREIFPVQGLFFESKDPMLLFDFVKKNILEHIDYDQIVILKQILKGVFKKNEINDELYISFLAKLIQQYGNDTHSTQFQLKMQKQRIQGLLSQIVMTILLLEKGQSLLRLVGSKEKRDEICSLIKDVFIQKKKNYLIKQFEKKIANI